MQLLLRSEKERALHRGRRASPQGGRRAVLRSDALKRYGDGDAVTVNSVRLPSQTRRAFAHSPLAEPSLRAAGHGSAAAVYRYTGLERSVCVRATRAIHRGESLRRVTLRVAGRHGQPSLSEAF